MGEEAPFSTMGEEEEPRGREKKHYKKKQQFRRQHSRQTETVGKNATIASGISQTAGNSILIHFFFKKINY